MKKVTLILISILLAVFAFVSCDNAVDYVFDFFHVTSVVLDKSNITIYLGEEDTLTATILPDYATKKSVTWSSNLPEIANVDENGKVVAHHVGEATITVKTDDEGLTATCKVTVKQDNPKDIPLTFKFPSGGNVKIKKGTSIGNPGTVRYSINDGEKTNVVYGDNIAVPNEGKISFFRDLDHVPSDGDYITIECDVDCYVYGNVMSLIKSEGFADLTEVPEYAFYNLFNHNVYMKNYAQYDLVLPAKKLGTHCYANMFTYCTGLTRAPILPATTLAEYCYAGMFNNCSNITVAPDLPAKALEEGCYFSMFGNCSGLTAAPILPAETLVVDCYSHMFEGSVKLNSIICLATKKLSDNKCTVDWLKDVAAEGTFRTPSTTGWDVNNPSGIPSGWTRDRP